MKDTTVKIRSYKMKDAKHLKCPNCGKILFEKENILTCGKHCFDIAKEGYVNLCIHGKSQNSVALAGKIKNYPLTAGLFVYIIEINSTKVLQLVCSKRRHKANDPTIQTNIQHPRSRAQGTALYDGNA